ncbi:MAG: hypothetical protein ACJAVV_000690 [Alphaproteobacteria bacterium]
MIKEQKEPMQHLPNIDESAVVTKAYHNAFKDLGLTLDQGANILGVGRSTLLRNVNGFDKTTKQWELQILFIRFYRSLYALFGGDKGAMKHWFTHMNKHVRGIPKDMCFSIVGLVNINSYLDALRGKV